MGNKMQQGQANPTFQRSITQQHARGAFRVEEHTFSQQWNRRRFDELTQSIVRMAGDHDVSWIPNSDRQGDIYNYRGSQEADREAHMEEGNPNNAQVSHSNIAERGSILFISDSIMTRTNNEPIQTNALSNNIPLPRTYGRCEQTCEYKIFYELVIGVLGQLQNLQDSQDFVSRVEYIVGNWFNGYENRYARQDSLEMRMERQVRFTIQKNLYSTFSNTFLTFTNTLKNKIHKQFQILYNRIQLVTQNFRQLQNKHNNLINIHQNLQQEYKALSVRNQENVGFMEHLIFDIHFQSQMYKSLRTKYQQLQIKKNISDLHIQQLKKYKNNKNMWGSMWASTQRGDDIPSPKSMGKELEWNWINQRSRSRRILSSQGCFTGQVEGEGDDNGDFQMDIKQQQRNGQGADSIGKVEAEVGQIKVQQAPLQLDEVDNKVEVAIQKENEIGERENERE